MNIEYKKIESSAFTMIAVSIDRQWLGWIYKHSGQTGYNFSRFLRYDLTKLIGENNIPEGENLRTIKKVLTSLLKDKSNG